MFYIADAVMGTGKSKEAIRSMNSDINQKFIVLAPSLDEVTRYKEGVSIEFSGKRADVVALDKEDGSNKTEQFLDAVRNGRTVIVTHNLFSRLSEYDLVILGNLNEYALIIDETITLVEKKGPLNDNIENLLKLGYIKAEDHKSIEGLKVYSLLPEGETALAGTSSLNKTARMVSGKHVYKVGQHNVVFVVPPEKLTVFKDVYLKTYLFLGSETHAWLEVFSIPYDHKELYRDATRGLESKPHSGVYSGSKFKALLTVYDGKINDIGVKKGNEKKNPLTKTWYESKEKPSEKHTRKKLMNNTRTFFRRVNPSGNTDDILWSCYKDYRDWFKDGRFDPKEKKETFLPWNTRGTNDYADRHYLAYLVNVHPHPDLAQFFQMHTRVFDKDTYALSAMIQWVWRSAIRNWEPVTLYLPSERMRKLLGGWLE